MEIRTAEISNFGTRGDHFYVSIGGLVKNGKLRVYLPNMLVSAIEYDDSVPTDSIRKLVELAASSDTEFNTDLVASHLLYDMAAKEYEAVIPRKTVAAIADFLHLESLKVGDSTISMEEFKDRENFLSLLSNFEGTTSMMFFSITSEIGFTRYYVDILGHLIELDLTQNVFVVNPPTDGMLTEIAPQPQLSEFVLNKLNLGEHYKGWKLHSNMQTMYHKTH